MPGTVPRSDSPPPATESGTHVPPSTAPPDRRLQTRYVAVEVVGSVRGGVLALRPAHFPGPPSAPAAVQYALIHFQWVNRPGCRSISPVHHIWNRLWLRSLRYFFPA